MIIQEYRAKYDGWIKALLVLPVVVVLILGYLFLKDATAGDIFRDVPPSDARLAAIVLFSSSVFILIVYAMVMLRKIFIQTDRLTLKVGPFLWHIPFETIDDVIPFQGLRRQLSVIGFVTSFRSQIEIVRKNKMNIRISVDNRDECLEHLKKALSEWKSTQSA